MRTPAQENNRKKLLTERKTIDEVESLTNRRAKVGHDEVDLAGLAAELRVEGDGPDLRVGREREGRAADAEVEVLQLRKAARGERQQARRIVHGRTRRLLVRLERLGGDQDERRAGWYSSQSSVTYFRFNQ